MDFFDKSSTEFGKLLEQISDRARSTNVIQIATQKSINDQEAKLYTFPSTYACPFHQVIAYSRNCYIVATGIDQVCKARDIASVNVGKITAANKQCLNGRSGKGYTKAAILENCSPISLKQATYISSLYTLACRQQSSSIPDLWLLCGKEDNNASLKKGTPIMKGLSIRGVLKNKNLVHTTLGYHGTATGNLQSLVSVIDLTDRFKKKQNISKVNTLAFSQYGLGSGEELYDYPILLEYTYNNPEHICCPPSTSAEVMVKISLTPGGGLSPVSSVYQELSSLLSLLKMSEGGSMWPESESPAATTTLVSCDSFIAKVKEASFSYTSVMEETIPSPSVANTIFPVRSDVDFCDMLWLFVKDAQSLEELQRLMTKITEAVFVHVIQPIIDTGNNAPLAKLLRKAIVCTDQEEQVLLRAHLKDLLSKDNVIQTLVEIGLAKLSKDYLSYFTMHELATKSQLNYYLHYDDRLSIREKSTRLCKLQCIVELTACILHQLPMAKPSQLAQQALAAYASLKINIDDYDNVPTPTFNIQLAAYSPAAKSTINLCSSLKPLSWMLLLNEEGGKDIPSTAFFLTTRPLLAPDNVDTLNTTIELDNTIFFIYQGHCASAVL